MKTITLGKFRGLAQTSTGNSTFSLLALDHRNNLRNALNPDNPALVTDAEMIQFKSDVVKYVAPASSSVLLDPELSAAQCISNGSLPGNVGLTCALEETGYTGDPNARKSQVLPGWNAEKAKRFGASAVKLLVYYHPKSDSAGEIEDLLSKVAEDCEKTELPLFVEPLSYSLVKGEKLSPQERNYVVIETARRLSPLGADVLKAEFPLDASIIKDERSWLDACKELTQASVIPWILLSASVDFETYLQQVRIACEAGSSGVAAGRAVWKESVSLKNAERINFLSTTARERMSQLTQLCDQSAKSWKEFYRTTELSTTWYRSY